MPRTPSLIRIDLGLTSRADDTPLVDPDDPSTAALTPESFSRHCPRTRSTPEAAPIVGRKPKVPGGTSGWPKGIRPYQLRHTFAIDMLRSGADLGDVQGLLGHASIQTTRTFYAPILLSRLTSAVQRRNLGLDPGPSAVPSDVVPSGAAASVDLPSKTRKVVEVARTKKKAVSLRKRP